MSEQTVQSLRDCLITWSGNRNIGWNHVTQKPVYVKDLSNEEVITVFERYLEQINTVGIAGMPEHWVNIFRKTYEEALESIVLSD